MGIKAIETKYNGFNFRSRLEARWAIFFDMIGLKYEYEVEGYEMNGVPEEMYVALEGEVLESPGWEEGIPDDIIPIFDKLCEALGE